ncbi:DEAD/DEAH box helicase [Deinococcus cellulosilyticus]|uniref:DNA2/NAM7 helicase-like C-terminal domain-containing protein n=1 Tax=Deinococcus cellulosilyticus (strain DSM 18568 / NBRC 106333 / KACC 11606 / 5516J-15) TaxID=1223518 RepID=A0A511N8K9_DEIC1|nr:DEAD/DEAH box helicase [Deinococcus cellulosilyticus]GEM49175.1 hypothetical protein DC3_48100 [Deinococcus cellulosilyticus NBRC 106333 = KACC 11606]
MPQPIPDWQDIRKALKQEMEDVPSHFDFKVRSKYRDGSIWSVEVDTELTRRGVALDESLEGATAWWTLNQDRPGKQKSGQADVLAVDSENHTLHLRFCTQQPPEAGETLRIYPAKYLQQLAAYWDSEVHARQSLKWLEDFRNQQPDRNASLRPEHYPLLRSGQKVAFEAVQWKGSFLWGPPGTGKTHTLGRFLAELLLQTQKKVLLLSSTNTAVDIALTELDRALQSIQDSVPQAEKIRRKCFRMGSRFVASMYQERKHLIPAANKNLIDQLIELEKRRPDPSEPRAYADWKDKTDALRKALKEDTRALVSNSRLVAMTTTRAIFTRDELPTGHFDHVVFDEASQVSCTHALSLVSLGKQVLFAGDPQQLAPVCVSKQDLARRWMGTSMFCFSDMNDRHVFFLSEQSRMARPICQVISRTFYQGKLEVARVLPEGWELQRRPYLTPMTPRKEHFGFVPVRGEAHWVKGMGGLVRETSALTAVDLAEALLLAGCPMDELVILTPFRAQRLKIRMLLRQRRLEKVMVSTVHRAQGSERHSVIFDVVDGSSGFLQPDKNPDAERLVNVALSRAKGAAYVLASGTDLLNPVIQQLKTAVELLQPSELEYVPRPRVRQRTA